MVQPEADAAQELKALQAECAGLRQQALQNEPLVAIGRLSSAIVHQINNPMQAVRGAIMLAQENPEDTTMVSEYLALSLRETERIVQLTQMIAEIYRPKQTGLVDVNLAHLVGQVNSITGDEFMRIDLQTHIEVDPGLWVLSDTPGRLLLAFLSLFLDLSEDVRKRGDGGTLYVKGIGSPGRVSIFISLFFISGQTGEESAWIGRQDGWVIPREIIHQNQGRLTLGGEGDRMVIRVDLPAAESRS
jgi:nitrogen-specific signal transduction histidine kinase